MTTAQLTQQTDLEHLLFAKMASQVAAKGKLDISTVVRDVAADTGAEPASVQAIAETLRDGIIKMAGELGIKVK